jgi:hypothetical protein
MPVAVEVYLRALGSGDLGSVPFAPSVVFDSPLVPRLVGVGAVLQFLDGLRPVLLDVRAVRHVSYGGTVAVRVDLQTIDGIVPSLVLLDVASGLIQRVESFHDPRPFLSALAGRSQSPFLETEKKQ